MKRYTYTLGSKRITIDTDSEQKAAHSFSDIVRNFFPDDVKARWHRETQDFYAQQEIAAKLRRMNQYQTATTRARAKPAVPRLPRTPVRKFRFD